MTFLKIISTRTHLLKASLLAVAAIGFAFPEMSPAQSSTQTSTKVSADKMRPTTSVVAFADTSANTATERAVLEDGNYLFGQSSQPGVNGATYAVLSIQNNRTVGAFYQPNSSYDCFYGSMQPNQLSVNVVDSYEQTVYPYDVAITLDSSLIAGSGAGAYTLEGFQRLDNLSAQDLEILSVCTADFAE